MNTSSGQPARSDGGDPSIEEILTSIRRILDEDGSHGGTMPEPEKVLQLDPSMMVAEPKPAEPVSAQPVSTSAGLVAPAAAAAAASSVGSLVRTLTAERAMQVHSGGPTLEDLVREEIRPILKEWLDTNLPPLVERLVRTEIERVVGRAVP
jgi:cell pole-organizing protein PopZ